MELKQKHIEQFKTIFKKEYGHTPSDDEAWEMASNVLDYTRVLLEIAESQAVAKESKLPTAED